MEDLQTATACETGQSTEVDRVITVVMKAIEGDVRRHLWLGCVGRRAAHQTAVPLAIRRDIHASIAGISASACVLPTARRDDAD